MINKWFMFALFIFEVRGRARGWGVSRVAKLLL